MNKRQQKIYRILVFLTCLSAASWAQAATYNLVFFDANNKVVGNGQFTTDPNQQLCYRTGINGSCTGSPPFGGDVNEIGFKKNAIIGGSVTIDGSSAFNFPGQYWVAEGQVPGMITYQLAGPAGPDTVIDNAWANTDFEILANNNLSMRIAEANAEGGSGTWNYFIDRGVFDPSLTDGPFTLENSGTWKATATPIPAAVWLFGSGLGLLGVFKRNSKKG